MYHEHHLCARRNTANRLVVVSPNILGTCNLLASAYYVLYHRVTCIPM